MLRAAQLQRHLGVQLLKLGNQRCEDAQEQFLLELDRFIYVIDCLVILLLINK